MPWAPVRFLPVLMFVALTVAASRLAIQATGRATTASAMEEGVHERTFVNYPRVPWWEKPMLLLAGASGLMAILLAVTVRRGFVVPPRLARELEGLLKNGDLGQARETCANKPSSLSRVVGAALSRADRGGGSMSATASLAAEREAMRLRHRASYLLLLAVVSPLFGVAASVSEIMLALDEFAVSGGKCPPHHVAASVGQGLAPLFFMLMVAILTLCASWFFRNRAESLAHEVRAAASDIVSRAERNVGESWPTKEAGTSSAASS